MFSHTAYDAYFTYLGLSINSEISKFLSSNSFFQGVILFIFALVFFMIAFQYFNRFLPSGLFERRSSSLSQFFKIIVCFILGISLLRLSVSVDVRSYERDSFKTNAYIKKTLGSKAENIKVSFVFDMMIRAIEEIGWATTKIIDSLMAGTHSQLKAPNYFFKSIMYAGASSIEDPELRAKLDVYSTDCIWQILPNAMELENKADLLGKFFGKDTRSAEVDNQLAKIVLRQSDSETITCLDLKNETTAKLFDVATERLGPFVKFHDQSGMNQLMPISSETKFAMASGLLNYFRDKRQTERGILRASQPIGKMGQFWQTFGRVISFENLFRVNGFNDVAGSSLAGEKAKEFNEHLRRAPFVQGLIKIFLIGFGPFLVFFIVAGHWRVLLWWAAIYASIVCWVPLWTLLYHIMANFAASGEVMAEFGKFADGFSLYSAELIQEDAYYLFTVFTWAQLFVAIGTTGSVLFFMRSAISDNREDRLPESVGQAVGLVNTVSGIVR